MGRYLKMFVKVITLDITLGESQFTQLINQAVFDNAIINSALCVRYHACINVPEPSYSKYNIVISCSSFQFVIKIMIKD